MTMRITRPTDIPMDIDRDAIEDKIIDLMAGKGRGGKKRMDAFMQCMPDVYHANQITMQIEKWLPFIHPELLTEPEYNRILATIAKVRSRMSDIMNSEIHRYQERVKNIVDFKSQKDDSS